MKVNLNTREEFLLKSIMKPMQAILQPNSPVYYDMAVKLINNQLFGGGTLVTTKGRQMLLSICEKIAYAHMDSEIESILTEVEEMEVERKSTKVESTKAKSLKKVTNYSERHQQVLSMINKYPKSSRRELAVHLGWSINRVTPRCKELLEMNKIKVAGTKYDEKTERNVETLELV